MVARHLQRNNLTNWQNASTIYSSVKSQNRYSCYCREYAEKIARESTNLTVLDAGCGDGEYTELFRANGSIACGCDGSSAVIELAKNQYPLCDFQVVDLATALPYETEVFDLIFCNLVMMDIDPIDHMVHEFHRILKRGGKMFFTIVHPAFYTADWAYDDNKIISKNVTRYITPAEIIQIWDSQPVIHYHRPVSFYYNLLTASGFSLLWMDEPSVYEDTKIPDIPLYLFSMFLKPSK